MTIATDVELLCMDVRKFYPQVLFFTGLPHTATAEDDYSFATYSASVTATRKLIRSERRQEDDVSDISADHARPSANTMFLTVIGDETGQTWTYIQQRGRGPVLIQLELDISE
ncbi:hypothetical protein CNMCM5623_009913 [Aspergillus felis]|uniref:Uncharacterized protein n=1 Tax=Aspergillus felis TaxID=1287682 RepID=A0A8H6R0K4_9EURO|nr:hypothetical protein CNMCM5623_009913 [Aspergillus felis]KAF7181652.1 hypothetical protein CNMCM7691_000949 [Aspergillus felis]